jgi:hypothetical protein
MPLIEKRTEGQINAAKRGQISRLGGLNLPKLKRKKCKRGKSCGASCIPGYHVCMVDIPWALNPAITKVANQLLAQRKLPAAKSPAAKSPVTKPETKAPAAKTPAAKAPGKKPKIPVYQVPEPVNKILTKMINNLLNNNERKNNKKNPGNK